jgi:hypothetical protein
MSAFITAIQAALDDGFTQVRRSIESEWLPGTWKHVRYPDVIETFQKYEVLVETHVVPYNFSAYTLKVGETFWFREQPDGDIRDEMGDYTELLQNSRLVQRYTTVQEVWRWE